MKTQKNTESRRVQPRVLLKTQKRSLFGHEKRGAKRPEFFFADNAYAFSFQI